MTLISNKWHLKEDGWQACKQTHEHTYPPPHTRAHKHVKVTGGFLAFVHEHKVFKLRLHIRRRIFDLTFTQRRGEHRNTLSFLHLCKTKKYKYFWYWTERHHSAEMLSYVYVHECPHKVNSNIDTDQQITLIVVDFILHN